MYIVQIRCHNVRGFRELKLDFADTREKRASLYPRRRTLIVGKNGTCKTTLLRCVALGLCDEHDATALLAEDIGNQIGEYDDHATIELDVYDPERGSKTTLVTRIERERRKEFAKKNDVRNDEGKMLVCAYGIGRFFEGQETLARAYRMVDSVYSLFKYEETLAGMELTMRRLREYLQRKAYDKIMQHVKSVIGLGASEKLGISHGGGLYMREAYTRTRISLEGWADGYRVTLLWLLDIFAWALRARCISSEGRIPGILLIDELEQHLHPSLQRRLLRTLGKLLPDMQILATTHSPSVALGASPNELVVLKKKHGNIIRVEIPDFSGYSIEDITRDDKLFDSEVYSLEFSGKLRQYERLISKPRTRRTPTENKKLKALASDLAAKQMIPCEDDGRFGELDRLIKKYNL